MNLICDKELRGWGDCRPASDPCLENLKGKDELASCSDGPGGEAVAILAACSQRACGCDERGDISHGTHVARVGMRAGSEPF